MSWQALISEARDSFTLYVVVGAIITLALLKALAPEDEKRRQILLGFSVLHVLLVPAAAAMRGEGGDPYRDVRLVCLWMGSIALVAQGGTLLFVGLLRPIRLQPPRLVQDLIVATSAVVAVFWIASRMGVNMSGLVATSAVLSAVIGLALQDTLGSVIGGVTLQFDNSVAVGDWVKIGDLTGKVTEIRWRYTAIETRNWETIVIPNNRLVKEKILVLGRRAGQPEQWRRWIWFNVDYRFAPTDVLAAVDKALQAAPIERVAADPAPHALFMGFTDSYARYAARYWLTDLAKDDPTDSVVRTRLFFALQREGIPFSIPAHAIFMTEESSERKQDKLRQLDATRLDALRKIGLFNHLPDEDLAELAESLRPAPFTAGETMTKQGAKAHWLYIIIAGEASVRVEAEGVTRSVARVGGGSFFGEMSLMTGAPRTATVIAESDVDCWRLDKAAFQRILSRRPDVAERIAEVLAQRDVGLKEARSEAALAADIDAAKSDLLGRIQKFFGLGD